MLVAVCNQKGGVGKTTVTVNLAQVLADRGHTVLIVDADPQANATSTVGVETPPHTLSDVLAINQRTGQVQPDGLRRASLPVAEPWSTDRIRVVASELGLATREQDQVLGGEARLREAAGPVRDSYDYVLIDCPPNLGPLTINALVAADWALLVTEARAASVEGLAQMVSTVSRIRQLYNPQLGLVGIAVNRYQPQRVDQRDHLAQLQRDYGSRVLPVPIPEREAVAKATSAAVPYTAGTGPVDVVQALSALADRLSHLGVTVPA